MLNNKLIASLLKTNYTLEDLEKIEQFFQVHNTLKLCMRENGLYPALTTEQTEAISGYTNIWIRDNIMITNYQKEVGNYHIVIKTMATIREYFYKHLSRFLNIIEGKVDKNKPMQRPHVRFDGITLTEINQKWPHAQNDALGYVLWMVFKLANENRYEFSSLDYEVYSLFPPYFEAIEYWQDADSGHWEEERKVESSSIGVVIAALKEMKKFIKKKPGAPFVYKHKMITIDQLQNLIIKGKKQLESFLPFESPPQRKADAALLFLIYPLEIVSEKEATEILGIILKELKGDYGIKRYKNDSYWCANYKKLFNESERTIDFSESIKDRNSMALPGAEAQWCIFDPIVSVIYAKRYLKKNKEKYLKLQTYHFNRSLMQLTPENFGGGSGKCAEAYYIEDSSKGIYVLNDHVPLAWTQANLGVAFKYMKKTCIFSTGQ